MIEIKGNIFEGLQKEQYIAHCISADFVLGMGIAKQIEDRFHIRNILKQANFPITGPCCILCGPIINLVTKEKYYHKPTLNTLRISLMKMRILCKKNNIISVRMPRIGCGLDKLNWNDVKPIIEEIFSDSEIEIEVYYL